MASLKLRKFTNADLLKTIAPRRLKAFFAPWKDYLCRRGLDVSPGTPAIDCDALARVLLNPDVGVPKDMIDALYYVNETSTAEDMDELLLLARTNQIVLEDDVATTVSDVAIQMWLADPDTLRNHHAEVVAFAQKHFLYFGGQHGDVLRCPEVGNNDRTVLESRLDDWFEQHRRGRGCRVFFFRQDQNPKVWIVVRHGRPMRREASHQDNGEASAEFYRPQQHDILSYDEESGEMSVHVETKKERELYLRAFGELIYGDEGHFPPAEKYTLDPLIEEGPRSLECGDVEGLERVRLVGYRRFWGGAYKETEARTADDIFASLSQRGHVFEHHGILVSATFKMKFTDAPKDRSVTIRPAASARYERDDDSQLVEEWLSRRGFILDPKEQYDDIDSNRLAETLEVA